MELQRFLEALAKHKNLTDAYNNHMVNLTLVRLECLYRGLCSPNEDRYSIDSVFESGELEILVRSKQEQIERWKAVTDANFLQWLEQQAEIKLVTVSSINGSKPLSCNVSLLRNMASQQTNDTINGNKGDEMSLQACNWLFGLEERPRSLISINSQVNLAWNSHLNKLLNLTNEGIRERNLTKAWQPFTYSQQTYMSANPLPSLLQLSSEIITLPYGDHLTVSYYGRLPGSSGQEEFGIITSKAYHWWFLGESCRGMETLEFDPINA